MLKRLSPDLHIFFGFWLRVQLFSLTAKRDRDPRRVVFLCLNVARDEALEWLNLDLAARRAVNVNCCR